MSGGNPIQGPWPTREAEEAPLVLTQEQDGDSNWASEHVEYEEPERSWRLPVAKTLIILSAISWVGYVGWTQYVAFGGVMPGFAQANAVVPILVVPLILLTLLWMMLTRSVKVESERITRTINDMRAEEARFGLIVESFSTRIEESRQSIIEENDRLMSLGQDAAVRLNQISEAMKGDVDGISRHSSTLRSSAAAARADMAVLLADLPKANVQTKQITLALQQAGDFANAQAGSLNEKIDTLIARSREAEDNAGGAAQKLASHLVRMEAVSETAGARMTEAASEMTGAVDGALERTAEALAAARQGMEAQGAAMLALIEQGQAAMAQTGAESSETINQRLTEINARIAAISQSFAEQDEKSRKMLQRVAGDVGAVEERIVALGAGAVTSANQAEQAMIDLKQRTDALTQSLDGHSSTTGAMIERTETLLGALDATAREIDETLPAAYERLNAQAKETEATAQRVIPEIDTILTASAAALDRLRDADALIRDQQSEIERLTTVTAEHLATSKQTTESMAQELAQFEVQAKSMAESTGPQLIEALLRVKETANQAAEHARATLGDIIPESAALLGKQSREALASALTQQVQEQVSAISETTELAVKAAQKATDRLMRQMLTISETTAALESRVTEAKEEVARSDEGAFARRVSLLIESLNSTAIDVTKLLSNEVTDTAWAAYLRGDRGVFTRRAVRLLETSEVREIARHYEDDTEFREQVNRYIRDFEGMLRQVLATRDGGPLSVTLLSSDSGKLYVALAQAIDRLRT